MSNIGRHILESFQFVSRVGSECDQLSKLLKQEISELVASDDEVSRLMRAEGHWIGSDETDEWGWVSTAVGYSLPIKVKPKRTVNRYLSFQISLSGKGVAAVDNSEPLVHVLWWDVPIDFEECWMGFPLDVDENSPFSLESGVLFRWASYDARDSQWVYSLRLTSLNTIRDVETKIVGPVRSLPCGGTVEESLPLALEGLVHYTAVDDKIGHYRIGT